MAQKETIRRIFDRELLRIGQAPPSEDIKSLVDTYFSFCLSKFTRTYEKWKNKNFKGVSYYYQSKIVWDLHQVGYWDFEEMDTQDAEGTLEFLNEKHKYNLVKPESEENESDDDKPPVAIKPTMTYIPCPKVVHILLRKIIKK